MAQFEDIDFPGWEVVRKIGEGSFGGVYEIHRTLPGGRVEKCALKKLAVPRDNGEIQELISQSFSMESITAHYKNQMGELVNEYSLTQELNSCKNVVGCYDVRFIQHDDGIGWDIYIRMELLNPLRQALSAEYQEDTVLRLGLDMCNALLACQEHSIIHRDIKPENILVSDRGEFKLGDFGIAKVSERTGTGTMTGTMGYMAPEVANRQHYGAQADIYSLGMVLYWMMNRRTLPFLPYPPAIPSAIQRQEAANRRLAGEAFPPPVNGSRELKAIVMKACAYSTAERYQSVQELHRALSACTQPPLIHPQERTVLDIPHPNESTQYSTVEAFEGIQSKNEQRESPGLKKPGSNRVRTVAIVAMLILACCGIGLFGYLNCWFGHTWQAADCTTAKICTRCSTVAEEPLGHLWKEATCTTPQICTRCGTIEGEALGHSWEEATCTTPQICTRCGTIEGEALGHSWEEATCTTPKTCTRCGVTESEALGHSWEAATCTAPKTCSRCGATEGEALGHSWEAATCTSPKTCTRCGTTEGEALGHSWKAATCTFSKNCVRCGATEGKSLGHNWKEATYDAPKTCSVCGLTTGTALKDVPVAGTLQPHPTGEIFTQFRYAVFDSGIGRDEVKTITFMGSKDLAPLFAWDVSDERDGSVVAWVEGDSGSYDLYIAANGRIRALYCSELFAFYYNVEEINFNGVLDTSQATDMFRMFQYCNKLTSLDLSSFDTSRVTDMMEMFDSCSGLSSLDVSGFDTSHVTDMVGMFRGCQRLTNLDLSSFDFSNVEFYGDFMNEGMTINGTPWERLFSQK